ncbi:MULTISPECIES: type A2 lantipeptide [unclassified Streptomyces]|uniref:type A2 lantipeptide n=1 Tax=unclassified Streptomyces TaxID=2593676 RepID=UPI0033C362D2
MNSAPQVATAEISDAELDNVSGGLAVGGSGALCVETPIATVTSGVLAIASPEGVAVSTALHTAAH